MAANTVLFQHRKHLSDKRALRGNSRACWLVTAPQRQLAPDRLKLCRSWWLRVSDLGASKFALNLLLLEFRKSSPLVGWQRSLVV